MRGQKVVVRAFGGKALVRRVWVADEDAVYVFDEQEFVLAVRGQQTLLPVGFPRKDVFEYEPGLEGHMASVDWRRLRPWTPIEAETSS